MSKLFKNTTNNQQHLLSIAIVITTKSQIQIQEHTHINV